MGYLVVTFFRQRYRLSELVKLILSYTKFLGSSVIDEVDGQWSVSSSLLAFNFFISLVASLALYLTFTKNEVVYGDSYLLQSLLLFEYSLFFASRIVNLFSQVGRVNTVYGLQLLVVFINIFTVLVDELYHIIYLKSSDQIGVNFGQVIVLLLCLTYVSSLTYSITSSCERTVVKVRLMIAYLLFQGKEFNTLLYQLMVTDKTSVMSKNIGAAVTTYLVILIQFAQPTPS
ncbi:unnamed protein product [Nezara viridula]|uniref:Uncharacterized protein n=1 Tax=Nezara viridula TaxID=85310 RepID=A0A9P0H8U2_NEZVI|nr:unnamed protein product [Nezara viridula]